MVDVLDTASDTWTLEPLSEGLKRCDGCTASVAVETDVYHRIDAAHYGPEEES